MNEKGKRDLVRLSDRMLAVAHLVPRACTAADVGTDHGYIPIWLVENQIVEKVLALDNKEGPLKRAVGHIRESGCDQKIETRLSDGLKEVSPEEVDTVVISGMGGPLMIRILEEARDVVDALQYLILQPQTEIADVRRYVTGTGFRIVQEDMVEENGKFYPMMLAVPGQAESYDEVEYAYGKKLLQMRHPVLKRYLQKEQRKLEQLLARLSEEKDSDDTRQRKTELKQELALLEKALARF